jgi:hypothetical protein
MKSVLCLNIELEQDVMGILKEVLIYFYYSYTTPMYISPLLYM